MKEYCQATGHLLKVYPACSCTFSLVWETKALSILEEQAGAFDADVKDANGETTGELALLLQQKNIKT